MRQADVYEEFSAVVIVPIPMESNARRTYLSLQSGFLGRFGDGLDKRNNPLIPDLCKRLPRGLLDRIANPNDSTSSILIITLTSIIVLTIGLNRFLSKKRNNLGKNHRMSI